jgi:anti-sigma B factor antagonist
MAERAKILVARFATGVVIRVEGAGTIGESPVVNAFAEEVLRDRGQRVIVDLTACTYMDSTFLGGLVGLFKRYAAGGGARFAIFAPEPQRRALFGVSRLDTILPFVDAIPVSAETGVPLEAPAATSRDDLARYIIECHRRLAEIGGPEAQDFARVADAIAAQVDVDRRSR